MVGLLKLGVRDAAATGTFLTIWIVCIGVHYGCGKSSEKCKNTWLLKHVHNYDVIYNDHGANYTRSCYDFDTRNTTALGDSVLSASSFFFILPLFYIRETTIIIVSAAVILTCTSFYLHATYLESARHLDITITQLQSFAILVDIFPLQYDYIQAIKLLQPYQRASVFGAKILVVMSVGYLNYLGRPNTNLSGDTTNILWIGCPIPVIFWCIYFRYKDIIVSNSQATRAITALIFYITGLLCLGLAANTCHSPSQFSSAHYWGHLSIGISSSALVSMQFWNPYARKEQSYVYSSLD